jgi:hypothetical protein
LGERRRTAIVQPGIRLQEGSARAGRLFDEKRERNREEGRRRGFGGGTWGLWSLSQSRGDIDKHADVHEPMIIVA